MGTRCVLLKWLVVRLGGWALERAETKSGDSSRCFGLAS